MTTAAAEPDRKPLDGIRVLDFSSIVAGPWCTRLMADCGAEIIKIEAVGDGDLVRFTPPLVDGQSRAFAHFNAGKHSVALDLKNPTGLDLVRRLIGHTDVLVENFRPGVMQRLGLDYASLAVRHPRLIYCSVSGFGQNGARAGHAAYAPVVHALSGFDHVQIQAQGAGDMPQATGVMIADMAAAAYAFGAIQTALLRRERFGVGSCIDTTLIESMMSLMAFHYQTDQIPGGKPNPTYRPTRARDGWLMIPLVSLRNYLALYPIIGHPAWVNDERYNSIPAIQAAREEVLQALRDWAAMRDRSEIENLLLPAGIACAPIEPPPKLSPISIC